MFRAHVVYSDHFAHFLLKVPSHHCISQRNKQRAMTASPEDLKWISNMDAIGLLIQKHIPIRAIELIISDYLAVVQPSLLTDPYCLHCNCRHKRRVSSLCNKFAPNEHVRMKRPLYATIVFARIIKTLHLPHLKVWKNFNFTQLGTK